MRKLFFTLILALLISGAGLYVYQQRTAAAGCNLRANACGYFTDAFTNADNNVLPNPALQGVNSAASFIARISGFLYSGTNWDRYGAAFIVDNMLAYRGVVGMPVGGGQAAGLAYAQDATNFNTWKNLVNYYASSPDPGTYGIDWAYWPNHQTFCDSGNNIDSGFDVPRNDAAMYYIQSFGSPLCNFEYASSMPEIHIYWPGGAFDIGTLCGNLQQALDKIPLNHKPTGTITVACDAATGQETATVDFNDADGATTGYITTNGYTSGTVGSGGVRRIPIPTSHTNPYSAQTVTLHVKDVGVLAIPGTYVTFNASTAAPCVSIGCGSASVTPNRLDEYMKFSVTVSVTNSASSPPPGGSFALTITPPAGATYSFNGSQQANGSGGTSTATFTNLGPANKTGLYGIKWVFTAPGISQTCNGTLSVVNLPYVSVYGGDAMVGTSPDYAANASTCGTDTDAGTFSWNNHTAGFSGAGAQYAVQTLNGIVDFASGLDSTNAPSDLTFANTYTPADPAKLNAAQGLFGGYFGAGSADCDFTSDLTGPPTKADTTIPGTTVGTGVSTVKYVANADVYISGNITYAGSGSWASIADIPFFKLVVTGGDIYVDAAVTQLDGLYIAESANGAGGRIYTCATSIRRPVDLSLHNAYTTCNKQLVINGAFVAKSVVFARTYGSVGQATNGDTVTSNHSAEVFNYTPEVWLPRSANPVNSGYTAITGLPPVL